MAAQLTALTEFSDNGNSRVFTLANHSVSKPQLVIQKRKVPSGNKVVVQDDITVSFATADVTGVVLPQRVAFNVTVTRPLGHDTADVSSALAVIRDIIAGDEFGNTVLTQEYLK